MKDSVGERMYALAGKLFPICRSITGDGFRKSLAILCEEVPDIKVYEIPSGTQVFDWTVPKEWNIRGGGIYRQNGEKVIDFYDTNLHIMGYSSPINQVVKRDELIEHIYTQPNQPDLIPYVTSFYKERWGFCMSENQKQSLSDDYYRVIIDSDFKDGALTYGELIVPGSSEEEILITSYLCHPSMANNELSGPVVLVELMKYVKSLKSRRYTYRFVINPETIGSLTYISRNLEKLQKNVKAGFVLSCVGDDRTYSYIESKYADTLADRVMQNVLKYHYPEYKRYSFLKRGSDERQYNSAGVGLPVCGFCRSKYEEYPEYHTSADNMNLISPEGLQGAYDVMMKVIETLEHNYYYRMTCAGEPQLGKRGLYPTVSQKGSYDSVKTMTHCIAYADGSNDLIKLSDLIGVPAYRLISVLKELIDKQLIVIA